MNEPYIIEVASGDFHSSSVQQHLLPDLKMLTNPPAITGPWNAAMAQCIIQINELWMQGFASAQNQGANYITGINGTGLIAPGMQPQTALGPNCTSNIYPKTIRPDIKPAATIPAFLKPWGVTILAIINTVNNFNNPGFSSQLSSLGGFQPAGSPYGAQTPFIIRPLIKCPSSIVGFLLTWANLIVEMAQRVNALNNQAIQILSGSPTIDGYPLYQDFGSR